MGGRASGDYATPQLRNVVGTRTGNTQTLTHSKHSNTHSVAYSHRHLNKFTLFQLPDHKNPIKSQHIDRAHCEARRRQGEGQERDCRRGQGSKGVRGKALRLVENLKVSFSYNSLTLEQGSLGGPSPPPPLTTHLLERG